MAVYFTLLKPGDTVLGMNLSHGGHLTHGHPLNFSGKLYTIVPYGVRQDDERLDYDELERLADEHKPKMIMVGASAYPRVIDFARIRAVADRVGAADGHRHGAHRRPRRRRRAPEPGARTPISSRRRRTRRCAGRAAGLVLCREQYAKDLDRSVFPGVQGGPLMHIIAAKAVCLKEAAEPAFAAYQRQIVANAARLAAVDRVARLPPRQRRHRQPPDAGRRVLEGPHRQGRRGGARQGRHHGQQEHDPLRPEPAARWPAASASARRPSRRAAWARPRWTVIGDLIARVLASPDDDARARRWCAPRWKRCAGSSRCTRTSWPRRRRRPRLRRRRPAGAGRAGVRAAARPARHGRRPSPRVFDRGGVLLAEAGTGTGKTLAYLVPAILSGQRVLVSTGTKNLQEQIFFKDLPLLREALGVPVHGDLHEGPRQLPVPAPLRRAARRHRGRVARGPRLPRRWSTTGPATTETGDRAELEDLPEDVPFWSEHRRDDRELPRHRVPASTTTASSRACASAPPPPTSSSSITTCCARTPPCARARTAR